MVDNWRAVKLNSGTVFRKLCLHGKLLNLSSLAKALMTVLHEHEILQVAE